MEILQRRMSFEMEIMKMNILQSADVQDRRERDSSVVIPDGERHVATGGNEQRLWCAV